MSNLDRLMGLEGASAAFEFSDTGELKDHRVAEGSNLTPETLDLLVGDEL